MKSFKNGKITNLNLYFLHEIIFVLIINQVRAYLLVVLEEPENLR